MNLERFLIKPRWTVLEGFLAIGAVLVIMLSVGFFGEKLLENFHLNKLAVMFAGTLLQTGLLVGFSFYIATIRHGHSLYDLGFIPGGFWSAISQGVRWGVTLCFLVLLLGMVITALFPMEPESQDFAKIMMMVKSPRELLIPIIMGVVLAPIGEEIYFRGFFYPALRARWGVGKGIFMTSLFFALMHLDLYRLIPIAAGGAGLAYLYERTGNIWVNIIAHAVWNAIMIGLMIITVYGAGSSF